MTPPTLGDVKLPKTKPYRVVFVGATYQSPAIGIGEDGQPRAVYVQKVGYRGEEIELVDAEAHRLLELGAIKEKDAPLSYDEQKAEDLQALADERGLEVAGSGADGNVLKDDLINALVIFDQGAKTDSGAAVAASAPGGATVSDARSQSGRRA